MCPLTNFLFSFYVSEQILHEKSCVALDEMEKRTKDFETFKRDLKRERELQYYFLDKLKKMEEQATTGNLSYIIFYLRIS